MFTINVQIVEHFRNLFFQNCHDYIKKFRFGNSVIACNRSSCPDWKRIPTVYGLCCSHNFHASNSTKAYVLNQAGKYTGLSILLQSTNITKSGFFLLINFAGGYITFQSDVFFPVFGMENFFRLYTRQNIPTKQYNMLPVASRRCYLPEDGSPSLTKRSRCQLGCILKAYYSECGCHPYTMPIIDESVPMLRNCTARDLLCIQNNSGNSLRFIFI